MPRPEVQATVDFDGYFSRLVNSWVDRKEAEGGTFVHEKITITAGPYRSAAVSFEKKGSELHLDFYSALRTGFGRLSNSEIVQIIAML